MAFFGPEIGSGFGELGGTPPPRLTCIVRHFIFAGVQFCGWAFYNCFCILRDFELIFAIFRTSIAFASTEHY